jgi:hypothetical protein
MTPRQRQRLRLCLIWSAPVVALALLFWWLDASGQAELAAAKERIRAAGLPTTEQEIKPPFVPASDNAMPIIEQIFQLYGDTIRGDEDAYLVFGEYNQTDFKPSPEEQTRVEKAVGSVKMHALLALIRQAVVMPGLDSQKFDEATQNLLGDGLFMAMDAAASMLYVNIRLALEKNRLEEAAADTWALLKLAEFLAHQPSSSRQAFRRVILAKGIGFLGQLSAADGISSDWNRKFSTQLTTTELIKGLVLAADGDRLFYVENYWGGLLTGRKDWNEVFHGNWSDLKDWPNRIKEQRYRFRGQVRSEYTAYLDLVVEWQTVITTPDISLPTLEQRLNVIEAKIASPSYRNLQTFIQGYSSNAIQTWKTLALLTNAQAGLALERHWTAKGNYPTTLDDLAPGFLATVPTDRFTGKPLFYRLEPGGATVWSAGENQRDDSGMGDDVVWRAMEKAPKGN